MVTEEIGAQASGERLYEFERETLHATAVVIGEAGVLICGPSGAGKSNLAYALITIAAASGAFARLIGDDRIRATAHNGRLIARGQSATQGMIELRGQGIVSLPHEAAAVIHLIVDLVPAEATMRYPEPGESEREVCGVKLRRLALPIGRSSYDCALLVRAALSRAETI